MVWNWTYADGEKKYYKPKFDFPTQPTIVQETSVNDTMDEIVNSIKEIITEIASEQSMDATTPLTVQEITKSGIIEAVNSSVIEETIIQDVITTTESMISTNSMVGVQEVAVDNATSIPGIDWVGSGTEDMFFNHNLTMTHQEFEESSQKLYIMLALILAVLIIILIFVFAVYNKYRKTTLYEMEGCSVKKNKVISKTSEACYGNDSVLIESNEVENYKF